MQNKLFSNPWLGITFYLFFLIGFPIGILVYRASHTLFFRFWERATEQIALSAYSVTFSLALVACFLNTIFGFLIAWILVRYEFQGKNFFDSIIDLPFALPTSVAGFTLVNLYSHQNIIGSFLEKFNIHIVFTKLGIIIAMIFVSFPFLVRSVQPTLYDLDQELEQAAWVLGASAWETFYHIIFPSILPSFFTGMTLTFSRAIGEYGSIVIISSNFPLKDLVASVLMFQSLEQYDYLSATIIGTVMLIFSLSLLILINFFQFFQLSLKKIEIF